MSVFSTEIQVTNTPLPVDGSAVTQPVSGTVNVGNFPATQPVSGPLTDAQLRAGAVPVSFGGSPLATVTNVSVGTSSTTLSASNSGKVRVIIYNETGTLFIKLGTTASSSSYSYKVGASTVTEIVGYTGLISGIKGSGTTAVLVTEIGI